MGAGTPATLGESMNWLMEGHKKRMLHLVSKYFFLLRNWKDSWCSEIALCNTFPTLFNLAAHKEGGVADVWDSSREERGWSPVVLRPFNDWEVEEVERFLHFLHNMEIRPL